MADTLTVEIWTDLICPWCWIGERRFERALAAFPQREQVRVVHRAFRLMPGKAPEPTRQMLAGRFGSAAQAGAMMAHVEGEAAREGLAFRLADTLAGDTIHGHRLVKLADSVGLGEQAVRHFYQAYFCDGRSVFDRPSLAQVASDIGLDPARVNEVLDGNEFADAVIADQRAVQQMGANGVPFFVFGGRIRVSGAQGAPVFLEALKQSFGLAGHGATDDAAGACGPDGCELPAR